MPRLLAGFAPYAAMSILHVSALANGWDALSGPTKLLLMPLLACAVVWGLHDTRWIGATTLLLVAIALSWLGDGAGVLLPWAPTVPTMLLFFGFAHICYIVLMWRTLAVRPVPAWTIVYGAWWGILLAVLWPHIGALLVPVALYGLVLGGTAVAAARCHPLILWGGVFFLASDTVLAFRLFLPEAMPEWTSPLVMITYTLGQGLIAAGAVLSLRARSRETMPA